MTFRACCRLLLIPLALIVAASCGSDAAIDAAQAEVGGSHAGGGLRQVDAKQAADIADAPPDGLVVLDVRTPEEFAEGHLDGAMLVDFYEPDFLDQLGGLDPDQPYLLYCRSGNRSGQTLAMMKELGFTDVAEVGGGINAWNAGGHPVVTP